MYFTVLITNSLMVQPKGSTPLYPKITLTVLSCFEPPFVLTSSWCRSLCHLHSLFPHMNYVIILQVWSMILSIGSGITHTVTQLDGLMGLFYEKCLQQYSRPVSYTGTPLPHQSILCGHVPEWVKWLTTGSSLSTLWQFLAFPHLYVIHRRHGSASL
jgi:hypothetical protein